MAEQKDIFLSTVVPIMDKVRDDLSRKQAAEYGRHASSFGAVMAGAAGPDGGMAGMDAYNATIHYIGKWNSKTVDDYIDLVKLELKKKGITVDAVMEKRMIDHLIKQQMPKSTADYILRKAAQGSIFYMPQRARTSSLQDHIDKEGERRYHPSLASEITGNILSWASNAASTGGFGGFWGQTVLDLAVEGSSQLAPGQQEKYLAEQKALAKKEVAAATKQKAAIPKWMLTQMGFERISEASDKQLAIAANWAKSNADIYRKRVDAAVKEGNRTVKASGKGTEISVSDATIRAMQYEAFVHAIKKEQSARKEASQVAATPKTDRIAKVDVSPAAQTDNAQQTTQAVNAAKSDNETIESAHPQSTGNYTGWSNLLDSLGLAGSGDTFRHLGLTLATLPDMLLGVFTGKTRSVGLNKSTMMPLAALIGGTFIKNPLLKIPLMLYGGANLVNKVGQEALADYRQEHGIMPSAARYKQYPDEELNPRIGNPHVEGNVLIVDIDHVPRIVTMPPTLADAYQSGAIPLNTLANHILAKSEQMQQTINKEQEPQVDASRKYEQRQQREQVRGIR